MRRLLASLALAALCSLAATAAIAQSDAAPRPSYQDRIYNDRLYYDDERDDHRYGPAPYRYGPERYAPDRRQETQRYGGGLRIMEARYGRERRACDATHALRSACDGRESCMVKAGNELCGDPLPGVVKGLTVTYQCNGRVRHADRPEPSILDLRCN